jgi:anion-transporting  ArsA/GET3 family ATPase
VSASGTTSSSTRPPPATACSICACRRRRATLSKSASCTAKANRLVELLTDPKRTAINLVTTAEEMPVNETVTMYRTLRDELHMPTGLLFVNRVHEGGLAAADVEKLNAAAERNRDEKERRLLRAVAARAREEIGWSALNARYRARLAEEVAMPIIELPFLFSEEFGFAQLRALAEHIAAAPAAQAARRAGRK